MENLEYNVENEVRSLIDREQFVKIWGFMLTDLKLAKTELIVYAVIFSVYKYYSDYFSGSRQYLQSWCNASKSAVDAALVSLEKKGLIIKEYKSFYSVRKAMYRINVDALKDIKVFEIEK